MAEYSHEWLSQQIVENVSDAIIFADSGGVVRLWNAGAERIFGFCADEMVGKSMDSIIPDNLRERHWQGYHQAMKTGQTSTARVCWPCLPFGRTAPGSLSNSPSP
jgi:PAS domain S-box-containing protein